MLAKGVHYSAIRSEAFGVGYEECQAVRKLQPAVAIHCVPDSRRLSAPVLADRFVASRVVIAVRDAALSSFSMASCLAGDFAGAGDHIRAAGSTVIGCIWGTYTRG